MIDLLLAPPNTPFAVALGLMLLFAALEVVTSLFGASASSTVDSLLPELDAPDLDVDVDLDIEVDVDLDVDGPGIDAPATDGASAAGGPLTAVLTWLCIGRVPALVLLIAFLTAFGLSGLGVQSVVEATTGEYLPSWFAALPALAIGLPATRYIGLGLARLIPKEETEAVSRRKFIGKVATIVRGEARADLPAEAKLQDRFGQTHYLMVAPEGDDVLEAGAEAVLVKRQGGHYLAVRHDRAPGR